MVHSLERVQINRGAGTAPRREVEVSGRYIGTRRPDPEVGTAIPRYGSPEPGAERILGLPRSEAMVRAHAPSRASAGAHRRHLATAAAVRRRIREARHRREIGRASCRERAATAEV